MSKKSEQKIEAGQVWCDHGEGTEQVKVMAISPIDERIHLVRIASRTQYAPLNVPFICTQWQLRTAFKLKSKA